MIITSIKKLRDPFILLENGIYYAYGTGVEPDNSWDSTRWVCYRNASGSLAGEWTKIDDSYVIYPEAAIKNRWAPEVHKYNGAFYMIASYFSSKTNHRGCSILKAPSPEGPFEEITNGHITQSDWDCIDGTLYVDKDGQPWMIFVHEWTSTDDKIGRMAVAKLSADLTHFVSEPVELFRADDPEWTDHGVTDGCFLYDCADGGLIMIWSNFDNAHNYCVGIAKSENGRPDGKWVQQTDLLFSKEQTGDVYDGGHGMILRDVDGTKYLCIHSPNHPHGEREETPILIPVKEQNGTLVCEF